MPYLLAATVGIFIASFMPIFISPEFLFVAIVLCLIFHGLSGFFLYLCCLLLGMLWGFSYGYQAFSSQLSDQYDKQEFIIRGSIDGFVDKQDHRLRFKVLVNSAHLNDSKTITLASNDLNYLLLSWYGDDEVNSVVEAGSFWQLVVRLRKPRGMLNHSGFDYQAWLFENAISATGYVVTSELNQPLTASSCSVLCRLNSQISRLRERILNAINLSNLSLRNKAVIGALTLGNKRGLAPWWNDLTRFGIVHLMVISGLHIGLVAGLGYWVGSFFVRLFLLGVGFWPTVLKPSKFILNIAPVTGLVAAIFYSLLAGFTLPTQRALIVVSLIMLSKIFYLRVRADSIFIWSLFLIALFQPLAVLSASFWLSFSAVLILLLFFAPRIFVGSKARQIILSQGILFVGMAAPLMFFIGQISWLSILANIVAVPLVSFIIVPLCLLAGLFYFLYPFLAEVFWQWAGHSISGLWYLLDFLPQEWGLFSFSIPHSGALFVTLCLTASCFLMPKGLLSRWLCLLPLCLLLSAHKTRPPLRLSVLDVGQGLAVVVEVEDKLMVYDAGPAYSKQFNAGSAVVAPFVRNRGFKAVEKLIISHGDMDHSGGFFGLNDAIKVKQNFLAPGYLHRLAKQSYKGQNTSECESSKRWAWPVGGTFGFAREWVYFDFLLPIKQNPNQLIPDGNNFSCVLLISWRDRRILLAGDIEKSAEANLLQHYNLPPVTVLIAPHHGSKTSSSQPFVDILAPEHVVFSAGYKHHFGHPHTMVVGRYQASGATLWNTATNGGISFEWDNSGRLEVLSARNDGRQFWWR